MKDPNRIESLMNEIKQALGEHSMAAIYRDRIRTQRTRRYELNAPSRQVPIEIMHTLLGIELKIGKRRLMCPDLSTARYLAVLARLGVPEVAVPYDITQIARLADDLESSWFKMMMLAEKAALSYNESFSRRLKRRLIQDQRQEIVLLGAGPKVPQFHQSTKQRRQ